MERQEPFRDDCIRICFFFNDTATTEIYTLSLHDALPICRRRQRFLPCPRPRDVPSSRQMTPRRASVGSWARYWPSPNGTSDRKSTRLNSSHANISYAVFCLKKKNSDIIAHVDASVDAHRS